MHKRHQLNPLLVSLSLLFLLIPFHAGADIIYQQPIDSTSIGSEPAGGGSTIFDLSSVLSISDGIISGLTMRLKGNFNLRVRLYAKSSIFSTSCTAGHTPRWDESLIASTTNPNGEILGVDFSDQNISSDPMGGFCLSIFALGGSVSNVYGTSTPNQSATFQANGSPYLVVHRIKLATSTIAVNTTWQSGKVYKVSGNVTVNSGVTLTVEPGTIVKFDTATSSSLIVNGTLNAIGTAASTTYFTSWKDDLVGGDTNGDATTTSPAAGDWGRIQIGANGTTSMQYVVVRYGGNGSLGNIRNNGGKFAILDSTVASSSNYGILSDGASASTTAANVNLAYQTYGFYQSDGDASIYASSTIHHNTHGLYNVGGNMNASYNLIFSNTTNGVFIDNDADFVRIDVSEIYSNPTGVRVDDGALDKTQIVSSNIHDNTYGVYIDDGLAKIASNIFDGNSTAGVHNTGNGGATEAAYNYWGAADGPGGAGPGSGDAINSILTVNYSPFLDEPHYLLVDQNGQLISSVVGTYLRWSGDPAPYDGEWDAAVDIWNGLNNDSDDITIMAATSTVDLEVSTTTSSDLVAAAWTYDSGAADTIVLNGYYLGTGGGGEYSIDEKINVIAHELGHALGLAHSFFGNLMHYIVNNATTTGTQDVSDYAELYD